MKIIRFEEIAEVPASHEDASNPGLMKKVLFRRVDLFDGHIQMINWATLLPGKTFVEHSHRDMQEVFIMLANGAVAMIEGKEVALTRGDAVVIEPGETHAMRNTASAPIEYIVVGIVGL